MTRMLGARRLLLSTCAGLFAFLPLTAHARSIDTTNAATLLASPSGEVPSAIEDYRLIHSLLKGEPLDQDVYDAAAWSAIGPLSEKSIANRSTSMDVPDFTRGRWKTTPPLGIVT